MTLGPIDFIVLEFPGNRFRGEILPNIFELVDKGIIRVIDLVIVMKDADGTVVSRELQELDPGNLTVLDPLKCEPNQMLTLDDINNVAAALEPNSTAGLLLIENLWALKTMQSMVDAGGKLLHFERIPHDVVEQALQDMAEIQAAAA